LRSMAGPLVNASTAAYNRWEVLRLPVHMPVACSVLRLTNLACARVLKQHYSLHYAALIMQHI
jgi:hypothetical protein